LTTKIGRDILLSFVATGIHIYVSVSASANFHKVRGIMIVLAFAESVQILPDFALVVHVVIILAMIWILNRTFFRPINRVIAAREKVKGGRGSETDEMIKSAATKEQEYKDGLLSARNKGYELIESERSEAVKLRQEAVAQAKAETAAKKASDLDELARLTETARNSISEEAVKLADGISSDLMKAG